MAKTKKQEEPKRIFKENVDIEVPKTAKKIAEDKQALTDLIMHKFELEQTIEKAKQGAYVARTASSLQKIRSENETLNSEAGVLRQKVLLDDTTIQGLREDLARALEATSGV